MLVIPAVDIKDGKCVRLRRGMPEEVTVFGDDPVAMARRWEREGAEYLHVVDLDGAFEGRPRNLDLVRRIIRALRISVDVSGGLRDDEVIEGLLEEGADRVVVGTRAVESAAWLTQLAGAFPGRIGVGVDVRAGVVATHGALKTSDVTPLDLIKLIGDAPLSAYIYTDFTRDGTNVGADIEGIRRFARATTVPVIGGGGVGSLDDIRGLAALSIHGVIVGRALYDRRFTLAEAMEAAHVGR